MFYRNIKMARILPSDSPRSISSDYLPLALFKFCFFWDIEQVSRRLIHFFLTVLNIMCVIMFSDIWLLEIHFILLVLLDGKHVTIKCPDKTGSNNWCSWLECLNLNEESISVIKKCGTYLKNKVMFFLLSLISTLKFEHHVECFWEFLIGNDQSPSTGIQWISQENWWKY